MGTILKAMSKKYIETLRYLGKLSYLKVYVIGKKTLRLVSCNQLVMVLLSFRNLFKTSVQRLTDDPVEHL